MSLPKPELVVLDLDGTLVDSAPDLAYSIDTMLIQLGLSAARRGSGKDLDRERSGTLG